MVTIGGAACEINSTSLTSTSITCTVGDSAAGSHPIFVTRAGFGTALNSNNRKFTALLQVTSVTAPGSLSFGGGDLISIVGQGFGARNYNGSGIGSIVSVCNTACLVISSNYTNIDCLTSPLITKTSILSLSNVPTSALSGTPSPSGAKSAFDNQFTTYYSGSGGYCSLTYDLGIASNGLLLQLRAFPRLGYAARMLKGTFSVSLDGSTFTHVFTITKRPFEGWNSYRLDEPVEARFVRYTGDWNTYCQLAELQFIGYPFQVANQSTTSTSSCTVSI
jgi:hypothetical protein